MKGSSVNGNSRKSTVMNTHMGNIIIDNEVIAQYAGSVARVFDTFLTTNMLQSQ